MRDKELNPSQECSTSEIAPLCFCNRNRNLARWYVAVGLRLSRRRRQFARHFLMARRSAQWSPESSICDGAAVCECRALLDPGPVGSDVEPRLLHDICHFSQQRPTRFGRVAFFFLFFLLLFLLWLCKALLGSSLITRMKTWCFATATCRRVG